MSNSNWNIRKRLDSFGFAFKGIAALFSQPNACIHSVVALIVIFCGVIFDLKVWEWCAIILCIAGVFMAETFNTSIETLADKVCREKDPMIGRAKDLSAGAVLIFVLGAVAVGLIIFIPKILSLLQF